MLKFGIVSEVKPGYAKVNFVEDSIVSDWLPVLLRKTKTQKESWQFDINEHVVCLMDEFCEEGVIIGATPNKEDTPDPGEAPGKFRKLFSDGTLLEYDSRSHKLTVDVKGSLEAKTTGAAKIEALTTLDAKAGVSATVEAATIELKGIVNVTGVMNVSGAVTIAGAMMAAGITATGGTSISSTGDIETTGEIKGSDVKAGTISLKTHRHTHSSGAGTTSTPTP